MKDKVVPLCSAFLAIVLFAITSFGDNLDETHFIICAAWFCISMIHVDMKEK